MPPECARSGSSVGWGRYPIEYPANGKLKVVLIAAGFRAAEPLAAKPGPKIRSRNPPIKLLLGSSVKVSGTQQGCEKPPCPDDNMGYIYPFSPTIAVANREMSER